MEWVSEGIKDFKIGSQLIVRYESMSVCTIKVLIIF